MESLQYGERYFDIYESPESKKQPHAEGDKNDHRNKPRDKSFRSYVPQHTPVPNKHKPQPSKKPPLLPRDTNVRDKTAVRGRQKQKQLSRGKGETKERTRLLKMKESSALISPSQEETSNSKGIAPIISLHDVASPESEEAKGQERSVSFSEQKLKSIQSKEITLYIQQLRKKIMRQAKDLQDMEAKAKTAQAYSSVCEKFIKSVCPSQELPITLVDLGKSFAGKVRGSIPNAQNTDSSTRPSRIPKLSKRVHGGTFQDAPSSQRGGGNRNTGDVPPPSMGNSSKKIAHLEKELSAARDELRSKGEEIEKLKDEGKVAEAYHRELLQLRKLCEQNGTAEISEANQKLQMEKKALIDYIEEHMAPSANEEVTRLVCFDNHWPRQFILFPSIISVASTLLLLLHTGSKYAPQLA